MNPPVPPLEQGLGPDVASPDGPGSREPNQQAVSAVPASIPDAMSDTAFKLRILRTYLRDAFQGWRNDVWKRDLDSQWCCDGRECCCCGETVRDMWNWQERKGG